MIQMFWEASCRCGQLLTLCHILKWCELVLNFQEVTALSYGVPGSISMQERVGVEDTNCHRPFKPRLVLILLTRHYSQLPCGSGFLFGDGNLMKDNKSATTFHWSAIWKDTHRHVPKTVFFPLTSWEITWYHVKEQRLILSLAKKEKSLMHISIHRVTVKTSEQFGQKIKWPVIKTTGRKTFTYLLGLGLLVRWKTAVFSNLIYKSSNS